MLNKLWAGMIIIGICFGAATGRMAEISGAVIDSAKEAVSLSITMLGVVGAWSGVMKIAEDSGLLKEIEKGLSPLVHFLFPRIPKGHKSLEYITTNIVANILGLGWGATPAGLKAMEELANLEAERGNDSYLAEREKTIKNRVASSEMCTFLILNISSLQLIPMNMVAYRSQYGSTNPTAIVGPAIIATVVSTLVAVVFCKGMDTNKI
ncbi:MAG: nucleoside recognition protein [Lachnospiraceae bacterium]|nr:nucleoside recognition protein [Lachnospiraceae bacterium]